MITRQQALDANNFHTNECKRTIGPKGGIKTRVNNWRRNGATQTWKTRPEEYRVPVKYGLKGYDSITQREAAMVHVPEECPLLNCDLCGQHFGSEWECDQHIAREHFAKK